MQVTNINGVKLEMACYNHDKDQSLGSCCHNPTGHVRTAHAIIFFSSKSDLCFTKKQMFYVIPHTHMNTKWHYTNRLFYRWKRLHTDRCWNPFNSLWLGDAVWRHRSWSTLVPKGIKPLSEPMLTCLSISWWMPKLLFCVMGLKTILLNNCHIFQWLAS